MVGELVITGIGGGAGSTTRLGAGGAGIVVSTPTVGVGVVLGVLVVVIPPWEGLGWGETEGFKETGKLVGLGVGASEVGADAGDKVGSVDGADGTGDVRPFGGRLVGGKVIKLVGGSPIGSPVTGCRVGAKV